MDALLTPPCTGKQSLAGKKQPVARAERARARLERVAAGEVIGQGAPEPDAIKVVQRALVMLGLSTSRSLGHSDGSAVIDGKFGDGTARGLRQFQAEAAIPATGEIDGATLGALGARVAERLAAMDEDERTRQRDVLDGTIQLAPAELKRFYRPAIEAAAERGGVKPEVVGAIVCVESGGGGYNRPKFEAHHFVALQDAQAALAGETLAGASPQRVTALVRRVATIPIRQGENGLATKLSLRLVDLMAGGTETAARREALAAIQRWTPRDLRELATSWGWGQIMGWHTLRPDFRAAGVVLSILQSQHPARQIEALGTAIRLEPRWQAAAQKADATGDYAPFAQAYNGAKVGEPKNAQYAAAMRQAAAEYRTA